MGGRGASSGVSSSSDNGVAIITKQAEPNKQGYMYYVSGTRDVISSYDDDGNYHPEGVKTKERINNRFDTKDKAISYIKSNGWDYFSM